MTSRDARTPAPAAGRRDDDFGFAIGAVFRAYVKAVEEAIGEIPGGPRGYHVLAAAVRNEAGSQKSLAESLGVDRTVMTYLLDDLEEADLVVRRPDPADRRSRHIVATEHGVQRWEEMRAQVGQVEQHLLHALPAEARDPFRAMLCTLANHVGTPGHDPVANTCQLVADLTAAEPAPRRSRRRRPTPAT
jgi:DNA-binding MarR family transcriptional regulator